MRRPENRSVANVPPGFAPVAPPGFELVGQESRLSPVADAAVSVGSRIVAEPIAGIAGALSLPFGVDTAVQNIDRVRDLIGVDPSSPESRRLVENVAGFGEAVGRVARAPAAFLSAPIDENFESGRPGGPGRTPEEVRAFQSQILDEGVGPTLGSAAFESTGSPLVAATVEAVPTAIASLLGVRSTQQLSPRIKQVADDIAESARARGISVDDASPENVERLWEVANQLTAAEQRRVDAFSRVGIDNPTRAQVSRDAGDFQRQQELAKSRGRVRDTIESQEAQLSQRFDDAIDATNGRSAGSTSSVAEEITGRTTRLDRQISDLYRRARERAPNEEIVSLDGFIEQLQNTVPSDLAMKGLPGSIRGNLRQRGIIDKDGNVQRKVTVSESEDVRAFVNSHFDSTSPLGRINIRRLKDKLDDDVFSAAGDDIFHDARSAKAQFESDLNAAKVSKFDKRNRNLIRDILENKLDPDALGEVITSSKRYRATDLRELRDFLRQTDSGARAFDDLRAEVLESIKQKAFIGPEDAQGFRALSRDKLQKSLDRIGDERLEVLFTEGERELLSDLLEVAKLREPVRGTALGKGPSAQAISSVVDQLVNQNSILGALVRAVTVNSKGEAVLKGSVKARNVETRTPASALTVPAGVSTVNELTRLAKEDQQ